jgi:chemotaxis protein MotB
MPRVGVDRIFMLPTANLTPTPQASRTFCVTQVGRLRRWLCCILLAMVSTTVGGCHSSQPNLVAPSTPSFLKPYTPGAEVKIAPPPNVQNPATGGMAAPSSNPFSAFSSAVPNANGTAAATSQIAELERKARQLDDTNRQLTSQLAQSQQEIQLYKDRSDVMQRQLADVSGQLQQSRIAASRPMSTPMIAMAPPPVVTAPPPAAALPKPPTTESTRRSGARLTANVSAPQDAGTRLGIRSLGYTVDETGGTIRLQIPADQLFGSGTAQLTPSAAGILDRVAAILQSEYSGKRVSIEGHTDNAPLYGGTYSTSHQLASAQTSAIFEQWTRRNQLPASQLTTLAHGANYPIADNQTAAGRAANRRIEIVIYAERN